MMFKLIVIAYEVVVGGSEGGKEIRRRDRGEGEWKEREIRYALLCLLNWISHTVVTCHNCHLYM